MFDKPVRIHFNFRFFQMTLESSNKSKKKKSQFLLGNFKAVIAKFIAHESIERL